MVRTVRDPGGVTREIDPVCTPDVWTEGTQVDLSVGLGIGVSDVSGAFGCPVGPGWWWVPIGKEGGEKVVSITVA